jgi:hypothetical protein
MQPQLAAEELPAYLQDRGTGVPSSMFGTYINKGDILFYPYYEFYYSKKHEYNPKEMDYNLDREMEGKYTGHEYLLFMAYGITDWLAIEAEVAYNSIEQEKSKDDTSNMPGTLKESGLGDAEMQLRWRWFKETASRPELYSQFETIFPTQGDHKMIGTPDWELIFGVGLIKGFGIGTFTLRAAAEYDKDADEYALSEFAIEYLKRLSDTFRLFLAVGGNHDLEEVEFITELQVFLADNIYLKLNNAFGITKKAQEYAPEVGVMFIF